MSFMNYIVSRLRDVSDFFYDIFLEIRDWVYPFYLAADFFYELSWLFYYLVNNFSDFGDWLDWAADELGDILSWSTIRSYIRSWLPDIEDLVDWWDRWWVWVRLEIYNWWYPIREQVKSWISTAEDWLSDWIGAVERGLASLQADFNNFVASLPNLNEILAWFTNWWGSVLTNIIAWGALTGTQIDTLIDSWFKNYAPFWEGWLDWKDKVTEFFTDPEDWLYKALDRIIERFW